VARGAAAQLRNIVLRPLATFTYNYFVRLGFLDGREGIAAPLSRGLRFVEIFQGVGVEPFRDAPVIRSGVTASRQRSRPGDEGSLYLSLSIAA
jgi:hypothetical protein